MHCISLSISFYWKSSLDYLFLNLDVLEEQRPVLLSNVPDLDLRGSLTIYGLLRKALGSYLSTVSVLCYPRLTCNAHVVVVKCICEPVMENTVSQWCFPKPDSCPQVNQMRSLETRNTNAFRLGYH